ncbi:CLUMA_CG008464, isoform A [Clunio marinus]|uniref:CLUMA_CG008464, isoform A n=1 Tax=Clunio marinus TaxID=568069 RepID=A0A1J1I3U5_9DIPT|nr:CLUMA_CG008464, isoform A [Clunio marinus]
MFKVLQVFKGFLLVVMKTLLNSVVISVFNYVSLRKLRERKRDGKIANPTTTLNTKPWDTKYFKALKTRSTLIIDYIPKLEKEKI